MNKLTENKLVKQYADYILKTLGYDVSWKWCLMDEDLYYQHNRRVAKYPEFWEKRYKTYHLTYEYTIETFQSIDNAWLLSIIRISEDYKCSSFKTMGAIPIDLGLSAEENLALYEMSKL